MGDRRAAGNLAAELDDDVSLVVTGEGPLEANQRTRQQDEREPPPRIPIPPHLQSPEATQP
jgi:hypothetical protein